MKFVRCFTTLTSLSLGLTLSAGAQEAKTPAAPEPAQLFQQLDKNQDGKISASEVGDDQKKFFERLIRVADKDQDGELTSAEFAEGLKPEEPGRPLEGGRGGGPGEGGSGEMFKRLDANGDGKLTRGELPERARERLLPIFERLGKDELTPEDIASAIGRGPGGGDGPRNPEEMFKRFDKNADGKLSRDEVPEPLKDRLLPLFDRLGKDELALSDLPQGGERRPGDARRNEGRNEEGRPENPDGRRPGDGQPGPGREGGPQGGEGRGPREGGPGGAREGGPGGREGRPGGPGGPGRPGPAFMRLLDADHDGRISKDELAKAVDLLGELDENKDGFLDPREMMGPPPGDGPRGERGPGGPQGRRRPEDGGPGGNREGNNPGGPGREGGRPSQEGRRPGDNANQGGEFARMDANGDGKLSRDEAPPRLKEDFDTLDGNKDGFIDREELRKAFESRRENRPE